jgi:hypothetical protein
MFKRPADNLWIQVLSVAGRRAAAQLPQVEGRTLFLLKTAYDPRSLYDPGS